jgi:hypothetical protein
MEYIITMCDFICNTLQSMQRVITDEKIEAKEHEHSGIQNSASFANWSSVDKSNSSINK